VTFRTSDKSPFGAYILNERATDLFERYSVSYTTISQFDKQDDLLILADKLSLGKPDLMRLNELMDEGTNVLLGANHFGTLMQDSLEFTTSYQFKFLGVGLLESSEGALRLNGKEYMYPYDLITTAIVLSDTTNWEVLATVDDQPIAISRQQGKGKLILVTNPLIFTNFGLLYNENHEVAESFLRLLKPDALHYTMFYQFGRPEANTPLRYFLSQPPLRWAIYLGLFSILVLLGIDSWRKQRSIPTMTPPTNTSIEYARTLGGLFYREGNHFRTAQKLIAHFFSDIRERYWLEPDFTDKFYDQLAGKSGIEKSHVVDTFKFIEMARKTPSLSEEQLVALSQKIDVFR
jgi:hypothetical protein